MSGKSFKYCFALSCLNNSKKNHDKYFFRVPYNKLMRDKWCEAVDRSSTSIKQSSTAFCCSDHFDMEEDLDRFSSKECPKLYKDAVPSLKHKNNLERNTKAMGVFNTFGEDALTDESNNGELASDNLYVREVVYIEEKGNEFFLEENEIEDALNIESDNEMSNCTAKNKDVKQNASSKKITTVPNNDINMQPSNAVGKQIAAQMSENQKEAFPSKKIKRIVIDSKASLPVKYQLVPNRKIVPATVVSKPIPVRIGNPAAVKLNAVNKLKYTDSSELNKLLRNQQKFKHSANQSDDDDDCILVEEQNALHNKNAAVVSSNESNASIRLITALPSAISVKVSKGGATMTAQSLKQPPKQVLIRAPIQPAIRVPIQAAIRAPIQPAIRAPIQAAIRAPIQPAIRAPIQAAIRVPIQPAIRAPFQAAIRAPIRQSIGAAIQASIITPIQAPIHSQAIALSQDPQPSTKALARAQTKLRVCEFSKISDQPNANQDKVYKLIRLMLSENQMLLASNKSNCVKIARTKPNEFKIFDNVYYYRSNDLFEKNYFFMNITKSSRHSNEIIQRNYGIFWGNPRVSCVGIVETKGALDEETKNFVFQQVKKSLINENGHQNLKLLNVVPPVQLVRENSATTDIPATIKPITIPTNKALAIVNIDDAKNNTKESNKTAKRRYNKSSRPTVPRISNVATLDALPTRSTIKMLQAPARTKISQDAHSELIRLSTFLTPTTRNLINRLKYFELNNGKMYAVYVGPYYPNKKRPYDIVFTESKPESTIQPVGKDLYVSKLVNYLFKAMYPYMIDNSPEPSPQNITSQFSAEMVETLVLRETTRIDEEIASLQASMKKQTKADVSDKSAKTSSRTKRKKVYKHECDVCSQKFERKYQLKRHQFIRHSKKTAIPVPDTYIDAFDDQLNHHQLTQHSDETAAVVPITVPNTTVESFNETLIIKTEKREESDRSLLIPLFEVPMKDRNVSDEFPFIKCKDEPEEHFEEITAMPLSIEEYTVAPKENTTKTNTEELKQNKRKRKSYNNANAEDTDSAPELMEYGDCRKSFGQKRRKTSQMGKPTAPAKQTKTKRTKQRQKVLEERSKMIKSRKTSSVVPVKISEARNFMNEWPKLTVDLVDIGRN